MHKPTTSDSSLSLHSNGDSGAPPREVLSPAPSSSASLPPGLAARYYQQPADLKYKKTMFVFLIFVQIFINYDSGAIPPSLVGRQCHDLSANSTCRSDSMENEFSLSLFQEGLLGSLVYLGFTTACFVAGGVLQVYSPKRVLGVALITNTGFCLIFSASTSLLLLLMARFFVGLTQAFVVIYAPVWVDEFAPRTHCTLWMSLIQAGVPFGIMSGYAIAGFLVANSPWGWRPAFYLQTGILAIISSVWFFIPSKYIDPEGHRQTNDSLYPTNSSTTFTFARLSRHTSRGLTRFRALLQQAKAVVTTGVWLFTCLALCALYFVVTGVQLWITAYLQAPPISADMNVIVISFTAISATAPIAGVLAGGWLVDRVGGYQGYMHRAALVAVVSGSLGAVCCWASIFVINFVALMVLSWFLLFFGAGVVPAATGILLACVSRRDRALASALSMLLYNLLGYFAGPFVSGLVASLAGDLRWSFRVIMLWSNFALISMLFAWRLAQKKFERGRAAGINANALLSEDVVVEAGSPVGDPTLLSALEDDFEEQQL
jgi:MFS family permease